MPYWLNDDSRTFLKAGYLSNGQTPENRIWEIAVTAENILQLPGFAQRFANAMDKGWISLSSPIWSNFGKPRVLPISCNGSYFEDSVDSILMKTAEIGKMSQLGAGTSAYIGALRGRGSLISTGGKADGPVHYMAGIETTVDMISQSNVRRGNAAVYIDVEHPDIMEFLECREEGSPIQGLSLGVCITNAWMREMKAGDTAKRKIWMRIIKKRFESGYPYIFWSDNVNDAAPQVYRDKDIRIWASNLCSEIALASSADWSFVCDLLSLNVLHYHAWKNTDLVETAAYFLDAVMTEYIDKTEGIFLMQNARRFAIDQRAIGLGVLGYHSLFQSKGIAFESTDARALNIDIFKTMDEQSLAASRKMAAAYGEAPLLRGYGERWVTRMAVAPTTSSSFILGQVSPSIEPENSNYYTKDLAKGKFTYRNPYLRNVLASLGLDTDETWRSILLAGGSVQHLDGLSEHNKNVFKTFGEINQGEIIRQAADRAQYIDQSQSVNLMIHPDTELRAVNALMIKAWEMGVKSLYYQRSTNPAQELVRELVSCQSCEA